MTITPFNWRGEYGVNTTTAGSQTTPKVAVLENGNYVVVWSDASQLATPNANDFVAQVYDVFGDPVGSEFTVNITTQGTQRNGEITALSGGGFVVTYSDQTNGTVLGQIYDGEGNTVGSEILIGFYDNLGGGVVPAIAALDNGGFVATWSQVSGVNLEDRIFTRRFDEDGTAIDLNPIPISSPTGDQTLSDVATSSASTAQEQVMIVWEDNGDVFGTVFSSANAPSSSVIAINTLPFDAGVPSVTTLESGNFLVVWTSTNGVYARLFNAGGAALGTEFLLSTIDGLPIVEALPDGGFLVSWSASPGPATDQDVIAQRFDASGSTVGSQITVNTSTTGNQNTPDIAVLPDGRVIVVWAETATSTDDNDPGSIRSQILSLSSGTISGTGIGEVLTGDNEVNVIHGEASNDILYGLGGDDLLQGGIGNDDLYGGDNDDYLVGGPGVDFFDGGSGTDTVDYRNNTANAILDTVAKSVSFNGGFVETFTDIEIFLMGSGNDTLMGSGVEFFDGGDGTDTIDYSSVVNAITVDLRNNTAEFIGNIIESFDNVERYILGSNDDLFIGGDANDYVEGGDGEDALNGFGGNDTLIGGADSDDYQVNDVGDMVIEMAGGGTEDEIFSTISFTNVANVEILTLTGFMDINATAFHGQTNTLNGNFGDNELKGGSGNDTLNGNEGEDTLIGGGGLDTYDGGGGVDTLILADTSDDLNVDVVAGTADFDGNFVETFMRIENFVLGSGNDVFAGDNEDNTITGGAGTDNIFGAGGNDTIIDGGGFGGNDIYDGHTGINTLSYEGAVSTVIVDLSITASSQDTFGAGVDRLVNFHNLIGSDFGDLFSGDGKGNVLTGGEGDDTIGGRAGDDTINGGDHDDWLYGEQGVDTINGGEGIDRIWGGSEGDAIGGDDGDDILSGEAGDDWIWGGIGADTIGGGDGHDTIFGGVGGDWIYGNAGDDTINGERGDDVLFGIDGLNSIGGGQGMDTIHSGYNHDWSWGGTDADLFHFAGWSWHDFIMDFEDGVDKIDLAGEGWGYTSASQISIVDDANGDAFISLGFNTWITVYGVKASQLTDADFVF